MNESRKFDCKKLEKLNNPERTKILNPDVIWENLDLSSPQVLVDIGAGTGFFASLFCKKMKEGRIYACDTADEMVNWMKANLSVEDNCTIIPTRNDESSIPLPDCIADLVYLINVYHELEDPAMLISEAYRLLKDGGKLAIIDWKVEETPEGPPIAHRISEEKVVNVINTSEFLSIENHDVLPYHYFLIGIK